MLHVKLTERFIVTTTKFDCFGLLALSAHAQEGYSTRFVCLLVGQSFCLTTKKWILKMAASQRLGQASKCCTGHFDTCSNLLSLLPAVVLHYTISQRFECLKFPIETTGEVHVSVTCMLSFSYEDSTKRLPFSMHELHVDLFKLYISTCMSWTLAYSYWYYSKLIILLVFVIAS